MRIWFCILIFTFVRLTVWNRQCLPYSNNDPSQGAFQKYTIAPKDSVAELPYSIPTSVGVVLPLGITTAAAGLYQKGFLALPFPSDKPGPLDRVVLIWGGSSSVGSCCIQLAKASGAQVFVTASSKNFDYCKKLGADECFDYHDSNVEKKIVVALGGKTLAGAYHAAGTDETTKTCARILDQSEGKAILVTTRNIPDDGIPSSVRTKMSKLRSVQMTQCSTDIFTTVQATSIFGNEVGRHIWREFLPKALKSGTIVPKPDPLVAGEELRSMQLGLDKLKSGVSAAKVVITNIA